MTSDEQTRILYQCVCGGSVHSQQGSHAVCETCGRRYEAGVLSDANADTMLADDLSSDPEPSSISTDREAHDPLVGQSLDHFRILKRIGRGGMGAVYRALDESLQRYVAIKVIQPKSGAAVDEAHVERLLQEARAQARVNHANVVHIYYVSRETQSPFLAMELVDGRTLADELNDGPPAFARTVDIAIRTCIALQQSARFDIVHGDVKPNNILIDRDGDVKLSDFGLSRRVTAGPVDVSTVAGTPNYLAPEVCVGHPADIRSDQYSLGVMLFEMTFGRFPYQFKDSSVRTRLECHVSAVVEFPDPWPDHLPHGWRELLGRLLQKKPEDRFENYDELLRQLKRLQPVSLPPAGRFQRGLAWIGDLWIVMALQNLMFDAMATESIAAWLIEHPLVWIVAVVCTTGSPLGVAFLQQHWLTTPGKKLFQIRIADRHGLTPGRPVLFARSIAQFLPAWIVGLHAVAFATGQVTIGGLLALVGVSGILADAGFAIFRRDRRSLHDRFFGTTVVLDVDTPSKGDST